MSRLSRRAALLLLACSLPALAMEPLGEVAGTAASTQGFLQMVVGALIGTELTGAALGSLKLR